MIATLALLMLGCAPQDAEVSGTWHAWLAANDSATVAEGKLDVREDSKLIFDCARGWDDETGDFEAGYIGPEGDEYSDDRFIGGACDPSDGGCPEGEIATECASLAALDYHTFLQNDGYYYLTEPLDAWRSEALINGEGDLQVTIHNKLGHGQDFRFTFVIKPDYAPVECLDLNDDGTASPVYTDGQPWLDAWSADEDGTIYYLNAGAYQRSPGEVDDYGDPILWYHTSEWAAGFGHAKFAAEEFASVEVAYGQFDDLGAGPTFETSYNVGSGNRATENIWGSQIVDRTEEDPDMSGYDAAYQELQSQADAWSTEISQTAMNGTDPGDPAAADPDSFGLKVESNDWRPIDEHLWGLDGWMEMHSSWVKVDKGSVIEKGGTVSGEFQVLYEGFESASVVLVKGTFKVDRIRKDIWSYPYLEDELREANETPYCGGAETGGE
ncbi:MAG: hypothetical protein H6742_16090 [Alphaproteobacteria bacterium]|nr:hypothetical protein [Alphaproteobacteria bacterium]